MATIVLAASACEGFFDPTGPVDGDSDADADSAVAPDAQLDGDSPPEADLPDASTDSGGCVPNCEGRECGTDGCEGVCGHCLDGWICDHDVGGCRCLGSCDGRVCGGDGCGNPCGTCGSGETCIDGHCVEPSCETGFGTSCSFPGVPCPDGSLCLPVAPIAMYGAICAPACDESRPCPDIAPGDEICALGDGSNFFCGIRCTVDAECLCGLRCRYVPEWFDYICYP